MLFVEFLLIFLLPAPPNQKLLFQAHGVGDQIYSCAAVPGETGAFGWKLKAPEAQLLDANGNIVGRHFAGPTWESSDRSQVKGKVVASEDSSDPGSIPSLTLQATAHEGAGQMSAVTSIQRLRTKGGKAPGSGCDSGRTGSEMRVHYEADYYFYGAR